jgi:hypothetical protein
MDEDQHVKANRKVTTEVVTTNHALETLVSNVCSSDFSRSLKRFSEVKSL